ncbi:kynureninase [Allobacillus halotolerans]|uniref:Kynureninase n=2 Tax=Allobacillus halotolerans TaxID=570278 RepID=A0ABS6GKZ0_9BACI|nr:kynureninase [Allobacillus halotolerans]MBU6079817.1 kynureninase [Allobacillus halotolerans]
MVQPTKEYAEKLDQQDALRDMKKEFYVQEDQIYLDGNSLGLMPKRAEDTLNEVIDSWKNFGIDGWSEGKYPWYYLSENLGKQVASLIGAKPEEVIVTGSTTTNLHQLAATFYRPEGKRTKILADELNFPSDIYALQSQLLLHGYDPDEHLIQVQSEDGRTIDEDKIIESMSDEVALIILPTVLYRSGQLLNIEKVTKAANERGIPIGWDGCHSVGAIPHHFHDLDVDFAYWCHYKYVNSGPGGVAGLFVHEKHLDKRPGLTGWFGSDKDRQFDMEHTFTKAHTAGAYQIGTPHIFSVAPLIGSLQLFEEAGGIEKIREKSLQQTRYMMALVEEKLMAYGFELGNPVEDEHRGGHICLEHPEAARIAKALKEQNVIPDFRAPNVLRVAPIAFYTSYADIYEAVERLQFIMENETYKAFPNERGTIA